MFQDIPDYDDQRPNQRALIQQLGGGSNIARIGPNAGRVDQLSPDAATANAWRNDPSNPFRGMLAGLDPQGAATDRMPKLMDAPLPGMAAPAQPKYGKDIGKREYMDWKGINAEKFDSDHDSPKYQVLRTLSHFDPSQGITPEVLAALNQLGLGTFSGQKDKLTVGGQVDPRFEGFTEMDLIQGFNDPNNTQKAWGYGAINPNAPQQGAGLPAMQSASSSLNGLLAGGDPLAAIQAAIAQYQKPQSNIQALLAQLGR